jgi:diguanylate cyclase (GGDEF)-like protein
MASHSSQHLILHNDESWRDRVTTVLERRGFPVISAGGWRDGIGACNAAEISCVVAQMVCCDGKLDTDTLADIHQRLPECTIIALVRRGDAGAIRAAFRAGAWDCLEEPVSDAELIACVAEAVHARAASVSERSVRRTLLGSTTSVLPEHSAFLDALARLRCLCRRQGRPLSMMMLDLDRFRECNERYSPAFGDRVLRRFASVLKSVCRRCDIVARYEADRFVAALPDAKDSQAAELASRCRHAMQSPSLTFDGQPYEITVSAGVAESTVGFIETEHQLIGRARAALDHAKHQGGGRTVTWNELRVTQPSRGDLQKFTIEQVSRWVERLRQHVRSTYVESTRALVAAVDAKDPHTRSHSLNVATYAETIGKRMQLPARMIETLHAAALLHDVGKIGVPDAILTKPGPLTDEEYGIVKQHPETALEILGHVSFLSEERPLILHHHERYDGTGYPSGLAKDSIPIGARILAVADALDTMLSPRTYKAPYDIDRVRSEFVVAAGRQFDPTVTEVTLRWLTEAPRDVPQMTIPAGT